MITKQKMRVFYIFLLIKIIYGNLINQCTLRNGGVGYCVPIRNCEMVKQLSMIFADQFCNGDRSLICCDVTVLKTTTEVPPDSTDIFVPSRYDSFEEHPNYVHFESKTCGEIPNVLRIAHGNQAQLFEFKFNALIGYESSEIDKYSFSCGGSLISGILFHFFSFFSLTKKNFNLFISENHLLTAGHCLKNKYGHFRKV